jgi:SPP1 family predicted phage head-tail adaptor
MMELQINAGDLRTSITFQLPTIHTGAGAAQSVTYANVSTNPTAWVQWINDHGQESVASNAEVSVQRATVRGRYRNDILTTWRVLKDGEPWQILSVDLLQNRRWFELRVERVKATVVK